MQAKRRVLKIVFAKKCRIIHMMRWKNRQITHEYHDDSSCQLQKTGRINLPVEHADKVRIFNT